MMHAALEGREAWRSAPITGTISASTDGTGYCLCRAMALRKTPTPGLSSNTILARKQPRLRNLRQVHLIPTELFEFLKVDGGNDIAPDELGDITTALLISSTCPWSLAVGINAAVETTGLRTPCARPHRTVPIRLKRKVIQLDKSGCSPFKCGLFRRGDNAGPRRGGRPGACESSGRRALL